jgi:phospholipase D1/2
MYDNVNLISTMDSEHTVKTLNDLNNDLPEPRLFIMQHRSPDPIPPAIYWSHHDKAVIIDANMVFWGGLDSCFGRWDYNVHPLADVHPRPQDELWVGQDYNNSRIMDFANVKEWKKNMLSRGE